MIVPSAAAPADSFCATHNAVAATTICGRCGGFMCLGCSSAGREQFCPACRAVGSFDAQKLARAYKSLVLWFGGQLVLSIANAVIAEGLVKGLFGLATLVTLVMITLYAYRTASALGSKLAVLWAIAMFIPCVNIITLLVLSSNATNACRQRTIPVGFLGPKL